MTEKLEIAKFENKLNKYKEAIHDIMDKNRINDENKENTTHLSYGNYSGKFILNKANRKEFLTKYTKYVEEYFNYRDLVAKTTPERLDNLPCISFLERPKEFAPIIIDVDLEVPQDNFVEGERLYDTDMIHSVIRGYMDAINEYLDVPKDNFKICLFEKSTATIKTKSASVKDGFHVIFPELCVQTKLRHLIRCHAVKQFEDDGLFDTFTNGADKIIDKAVVSTNAWFLYGSKKPDGQLYTLSAIYDKDLNKEYDKSNLIDIETGEPTEPLSVASLISYFSLQTSTYGKDNATPLQDEYVNSDIDAVCVRFGVNPNIKSEPLKYNVPASKEEEIRKANKFVSMLSEKRSNDYNDWLYVGFALHNIDQSMMPTWIDFSKKCVGKFNQDECERVWESMKNPSNGNVLTINTLAYYAKMDNPKLYEEFVKEEQRLMRLKSLDGNTYYIAKNVYCTYGHLFKCSSISKNVWYEFSNHRWNRVEEGYSLKARLSEDFANQYLLEVSEIAKKAMTASGIEKDDLQNRRMRTEKIIEKLMNNSFKKTIMDECASIFYDAKFEEKLDSNTNLIGFENGVFDLEQGVFREGRPDDYITLSTKNDYQKWNEKNPNNINIMKFFSQVLPNEKVRDYFMKTLSTFVSGDVNEEKFYIMTGSGSNGKSLTMDLVIAALGDYYMSCPIAMLTRKRDQSNNADPIKTRMKGRRCGVFQEADEGDRLNVGLMKEMTGGDLILCRDLFKGSADMIQFKPQMKMILTCNQLPDVPSNDDGTWRRLRVIDFISKFIDNPTKPNEFKIDIQMKQKIKQWAPAFISYLINVYLTQYKNKGPIKEPIEVMASTNQYKMENDTMTEFKEARLVASTDPTDAISHEALWDDYKAFIKNINDKQALPKRPEFMKFIAKAFDIKPKNNRFYGIKFIIINEDNNKPGDLDV